MRAITRETIIDRRQPGIRWGAVFAGAVVAVAVWFLLQVFDVGAGLAGAGSMRAGAVVGIGASWWTLVSALVAMFFGGVVAARLAGTPNGALHGLVVWGLTIVAGLIAGVWLVGAIAVGALHDGGVTLTTRGANGGEQIALEAARASGQALLWGGFTLLVGLIGAVIGGAIGTRRDVRRPPRERELERDVTDVPPPAPPLATPAPPVPPAH